MNDAREKELLRLGKSDWYVWREVALRSAGLPATAIEALSDETLLGHAEALRAGDEASEAFPACYAEAAERRSGLLRVVATNPLLREAVAWQNPAVLDHCLDKVATHSRVRKWRHRESKVVAYLQRYALKNDTIGFFGPVGWAQWTDDSRTVEVHPGARLLRRRRVYLEDWAMDAVAHALLTDHALKPWLRPRLSDAVIVVDGLAHRTRGGPVELTPQESFVLAHCDGQRTTREIDQAANGLPVSDIVDRLREMDLVTLGFDQRHGDRPENELRRWLLTVGDATARDHLVSELDGLLMARDRVAAAAGSADRLALALRHLDERFERITGESAARRPGESYAGRRLVYEDTVRDVRVTLGPGLLDSLALPLGLLLDSARWFVGQVAESYRRRLSELFDRCRARTGADRVPFPVLLAAATPDLVSSAGDLAPPVAAVVPMLRQRWSSILRIPDGVRRHTVRAETIAQEVRCQFPATYPPWSSAVHHCPDIMIAAPSVDAIVDGGCQIVLGELHLAMNTLDSAFMCRQHTDPQRLTALDAVDRGGFRVVPVPARDSPAVNSRTYPPMMLRPEYLYWTVSAYHTGAPGRVYPGAGMTVHKVADRLVVTFPHDSGTVDLLEVLGEYLSAAVLNGFRLLDTKAHQPRVTIDSLVVSREAWSIAACDLRWVFRRNAAQRYGAAVAWRGSLGMPRRVFYRVAGEDKPLFVDFASSALVDLLATTVRRAIDDDPNGTVSLAEMLPDLGEQWLRDAYGAAYTSELRLVMVDGTARRPAAPPHGDTAVIVA